MSLIEPIDEIVGGRARCTWAHQERREFRTHDVCVHVHGSAESSRIPG
jgi:hypothetical protein